MAEGHLKNISRIREQGTYARLHNTVGGVETETKITERMWGILSERCLPNKTGYWGPIQFQEGSYDIKHDYTSGAGAYNFEEYPLFFALGDKYRVATFDAPGEAISEQVNGIQILGWGVIHLALVKGLKLLPAQVYLKVMHAVDIAPTILELMGAPIPEYMDSKPLIEKSISKVGV